MHKSSLISRVGKYATGEPDAFNEARPVLRGADEKGLFKYLVGRLLYGTGPPCPLSRTFQGWPSPNIAFRLSSEAGAHARAFRTPLESRIDSSLRGGTLSFSSEEAVF